MTKHYSISYAIQHGKFTKEDLRSKGLGGCDGVILHSILYPEDGSRDEAIVSSGPDGKPLSDLELWKSWVGMAYSLSESKTLSETKREFCKAVFESVREALLKVREENETPNPTT